MKEQQDPEVAPGEAENQQLRRELEEAKVILAHVQRRKSSLLAMAVHDLRTPLAIIQGYSQLLAADLKADTDADAREYIVNIVAHANSLGAMIDNLVLYDQVERGELRLSFNECQLMALVEQAMAQVEGLMSIKNLAIRLKPMSSPIVTADEIQIARVLYSLFGHATKYGQPGSELFLDISDDGEYGHLSLRDANLFLNDDMCARLFDLVEENRKGGTGLRGMDMGLVVARHIVEAHGGRLEAACLRGAGTSLHLYLPLVDKP